LLLYPSEELVVTDQIGGRRSGGSLFFGHFVFSDSITTVLWGVRGINGNMGFVESRNSMTPKVRKKRLETPDSMLRTNRLGARAKTEVEKASR
jgi:hypothetical protein